MTSTHRHKQTWLHQSTVKILTMEKERKEIKALEELKDKTTNFEEQMEIADRIHNLKMKIN